MSHAEDGARFPRRRWSIGLLAVVAVGAVACGSGGGGSSAQVSIHGLVHRTGCPVTAPRQGPFRGTIVFSASGGGRRLVRLDGSGRAALTLPAGRYRVVVDAPRARILVRVALDGHALPVAAGGRFSVRISPGEAAALVIVVGIRPHDCNGLGASG